MRPSDIKARTDLYECPECGTRIEAPETRICEDCDSKLQNISRPRDL